MAAKDYQGAIEAYSEAINLDGSNKVYYSNRQAYAPSRHPSPLGAPHLRTC